MFCGATMTKKANDIVDHYEKYSGTSLKTYSTPGIPNENLIKIMLVIELFEMYASQL